MLTLNFFSSFFKIEFFFHPSIFDLLGVSLRAFIFNLLSMGLSQSYIHGRKFSGLTWVDLDFCFVSVPPFNIELFDN